MKTEYANRGGYRFNERRERDAIVSDGAVDGTSALRRNTGNIYVLPTALNELIRTKNEDAEAQAKTEVQRPVVFMKRYELKYLISAEQRDFLLERLCGHMKADKYGLTSIASLYYDTPDRRLIRASVEKPEFKEKIRLRSYGLATESSPVFLELKRKAYGVVYKRRVQSTIPQVNDFFSGEGDVFEDGQISRELVYSRDHYQRLEPSCLIIYDRTAYFEPDGDLRLTIDRSPRFRTEGLDLTTSLDGTPLLGDDMSILEIKVQQAMPLWLTQILSEGKMYKSSFSKYGEAYRQTLQY